MLYDGLRVLGGGSILGGLILGAIAVFIIDRDFTKAAGFALAGAVLTFFGFMHGEQIGIGQTPTVAVSYLVIAGIFTALSPRSPLQPRRWRWSRRHASRGDGAEVQCGLTRQSSERSARGVTESPVDAAAVHAEEPRRLHHVAGGFLQRALDQRLLGRFEVQGQAGGRRGARGSRRLHAAQRCPMRRRWDGSIGSPPLSMSARSIMFFSSRTLPGNV